MRLGVGVKLSLALLVLVTAALAIVYVAVVPSLEDRLVTSKVHRAHRQVGTVAGRYRVEADALSADLLAQAYPAYRIAIFRDLGGRPSVYDDSAAILASGGLEDDPLVAEAFRRGGIVSGTVRRHRARYAEAAELVSTPEPRVVLLSTSVESELGDIKLVKRRLLAAGGVALLLALALGFGAATLHARRIRRLERAANRIAHGHFDEPVVDRGADELGELAAAFEHMRRRLAALDDARREFVANASHELRTPLFALGAALELLEDETMDDATRDDFLRTMQEQVDRLTRLAGDLLDLTRIDAGRLPIEAGEVDLAATASTLGREFEAAALAVEHPLVVEADGRAAAHGDGDRVLRIGRALVENALRHTPPGTSVRISAAQRDGRAVLEVRDDGPGVPPDQLEHVFQRFYRVDGTRASGSGLGLAIARELAELMDGELTLGSDHGTVVRLSLPAFSRENIFRSLPSMGVDRNGPAPVRSDGAEN
jgi:signal transduction histidine kinase